MIIAKALIFIFYYCIFDGSGLLVFFVYLSKTREMSIFDVVVRRELYKSTPVLLSYRCWMVTSILLAGLVVAQI